MYGLSDLFALRVRHNPARVGHDVFAARHSSKRWVERWPQLQVVVSRVRDAAAVRVFPPAIPLVAILAGVGLQYLWPISIGAEIPDVVRYWIGGLIFVGGCSCSGGWSVLLMRRSGQSDTRGSPPRDHRARSVSFTRNPMYLQMVVACIGVAVSSRTLDSASVDRQRLGSAEIRNRSGREISGAQIR